MSHQQRHLDFEVVIIYENNNEQKLGVPPEANEGLKAELSTLRRLLQFSNRFLDIFWSKFLLKNTILFY